MDNCLGGVGDGVGGVGDGVGSGAGAVHRSMSSKRSLSGVGELR